MSTAVESIPAALTSAIFEETDKMSGPVLNTCTPDDLVNILDKTNNVLILDLRTECEIETSCLKRGIIVHIPQDVLSASITEGNFDTKLKLSDRVRYRKRHEYDYIILLDEQSTKEQINQPHSPLWRLYEYMIADHKVRKCPLVLEGGFTAFQAAYPTHVALISEIRQPLEKLSSSPNVKLRGSNLSYDAQRLSSAWKSTRAFDHTNEVQNVARSIEDLDDYLDMYGFLDISNIKRPERKALLEVSKVIKESSYDIRDQNEVPLPAGRLSINEMQSVVNAHEMDKDLFQSIIAYKVPDNQHKKLAFDPSLRKVHVIPPLDLPFPLPQRQFAVRNMDEPFKLTHDGDQEDDINPKKRTFIATGLWNLGNTCYMNSSIQCLVNNASFAAYFLRGAYVADINTANKLGSKGNLAYTFAALLERLNEKAFNFRPNSFKSVFCSIVNYFDNNDQHDAAECVTMLLEGLHEDLNRVKVKTIPVQLNSEGKTLKELAQDFCAQWAKTDDSVVRDNFWGVEVVDRVCDTCGAKFPFVQPISVITLPLSDTSSCQLEQCLDQFFQSQKIGMTCSKCNVPREITENRWLYRTPKFPILQFERFHRTSLKSEIRKLSTKVEFSVDKPLNLEKYLLDKTASRSKFDLNASIKHYGTVRGGHYVAICRKNGQWIEFDDEDVKYIDVDDVNAKESYILFYEPHKKL